METRSTNKKRQVGDEAGVERKVDDEADNLAGVERKVDELRALVAAHTEKKVEELCALVAAHREEMKKRVHNVMITDKEYEEIMSKVSALPEKKQKNWKGRLRNKQGVLSKLRYRDGNLQNLEGDDWNTVISESIAKSKGTIISTSDFAKWSLVLEKTHPELPMDQKLLLWHHLNRSDRQHTDPRRHGAGRDGETGYTWTKDSTPKKKMKKIK